VIHLRNEVQELKKNLNKNAEDPKSCLPKLPIDDMAELKNFDEVLQSDETMKSQFVSQSMKNIYLHTNNYISNFRKPIFAMQLKSLTGLWKVVPY